MFYKSIKAVQQKENQIKRTSYVKTPYACSKDDYGDFNIILY